MSDSSSPSKVIPSELRLTAKWDFAAETAIKRVGLGLAVCGLTSFVLFRGRCARISFAAFGAGFGAGDAYRIASVAFDKEKDDGNK